MANRIETELKKHGIQYNPTITLNSYQGIINMVEKNIGIAIVSLQALKGVEGVQILEIENLKFDLNLIVCSLEDRALSPACLKFIHILKAMYA